MNNSYNVENGKTELPPVSWWKKRSKLEKKLSVFTILAALLIFILVIVVIIHFTKGPTTCLTPTCVQTTGDLLSHMDLSIDPCENFYQFACGGFTENVQLEEEQQFKRIETIVINDIDTKLQSIIEEPIDFHDPRSLILAKKMYKACMNESVIEERGLRLFKNHLNQLGGWPVLEGNNWQERNFEWKKVTYKLRQLGYRFEMFIDFGIINDKNDPLRRVIQLNMPRISFSAGNDKMEEQYYDFMVNLSVALGADRMRAKNELRDVIDFQKSLFLNSHESDEDARYDPLTMSELQYKFHGIPWLEYFNTLQGMVPNITHGQLVTVSNPSYYIRLQNALRSISKRVIANYMFWSLIEDYVLFLNRDVADVFWNRYREYTKSSVILARWKLCKGVTQSLFSLPVKAAYIKRFFSKTTKIHATEILQNIKEEFRKKLNDLEWMDQETRTRALERMSLSKQFVGYPEDLFNNDKIEERYIGVQIDEDQFLAALLNTRFYTTNYRFRRLHELGGTNEELDSFSAIFATSSYSPDDNLIEVPAGLLQGFIYGEDRPQYLNYGALGSALGHEVFHIVFQDKNNQHDSKYYDWITAHTLRAYSDKLSCVERHYGRYSIKEVGEYLNSSNTKYEDLADIAGVKLAYDAYNSWIKENGPEQKLPGLNYTPQQLFWISSAVRLCEKTTDDFILNNLGYSSTSTSKYRAIGSLRNSEEFSSDFACSRDSYMNAEDRCIIF